ncbi:hypothetical protein B7463_g7179, partial [Scytalidium lignicola]
MDTETRVARNELFLELKPICIKVSQLVLVGKEGSNNHKELIESVNGLLDLLQRKCRRVDGVFDEKLADYVFFPLAQLLRKKQTFTDRLTESIIRCLTVLLEYGWRGGIPLELGKQLLMLLTIVIDGVPGSDRTVPPAEELIVESYRALAVLFRDLRNTTSGATTLVETDTAPALAHCVTVILDGITNGASADVQQRALEALDAVWVCIKDPAALSSFLPGITSALTKSLTPNTAARKSRRTIILAVRVLENVLVSMLGDIQTRAYSAMEEESSALPIDNKEERPLTRSWLKVTTAQVKLALSNVMRLRTHEASDVRSALNRLCLVLLDECHDSLSESASILVETAMVLVGTDLDKRDSRTNSDLKSLAIVYPGVGQLIKVTIYNWIISLPRMMQANDETAKQNLLHHISGSLELLTSLNLDSSILEEALADSLREGVVVTLKTIPPRKALQETTLVSDHHTLVKMESDAPVTAQFDTIIMRRESQKQTRKEFITLLSKFDRKMQLGIAGRMLDYIHNSSGPDRVSALWLCSELMRSMASTSEELDEFIEPSVISTDNEEALSQELFSYSVSIISALEDTNLEWHLQAIALEVVAGTAQRLKLRFKTELVDVLYPVAQLLGSSYLSVRDHAITCLNIISICCGYNSTSELIIDNSDYMVNSISLKLNTFDISPQAPQVLAMLIRLTGPFLLLYLDDVVGSIFAALDNFHGYPQLVDSLFSVLGEVVESGSRSSLVSSEATKVIEDRKPPLITPNVGVIVDIINKKASRNTPDDSRYTGSFPKLPWKDAEMLLDKRDEYEDQEAEDETRQNFNSGEIQNPPPSKVYSMLESITRLSQHYLTNKSPILRARLLHLISTSCDSMRKNEDRFLPLINDIWPVVIGRVYDEEPFVAIAGAEAVAEICKCAGDFMSTRIQVEWPDLMKLAARLKSSVLVEKKAGGTRGIYSQNYQIWESVVKLMTFIVRYVKISDDTFDEILGLLEFIIPTRSDVQDALSLWNADAVWLSQYLQGQINFRMDCPALEGCQFLKI